MSQEKEVENQKVMLEELRFHLEEGPEFENIQNPVEGLNIFGALVALLPEYHPALEIFISCHW